VEGFVACPTIECDGVVAAIPLPDESVVPLTPLPLLIPLPIPLPPPARVSFPAIYIYI
jgi:hypothetical protein